MSQFSRKWFLVHRSTSQFSLGRFFIRLISLGRFFIHLVRLGRLFARRVSLGGLFGLIFIYSIPYGGLNLLHQQLPPPWPTMQRCLPLPAMKGGKFWLQVVKNIHRVRSDFWDYFIVTSRSFRASVYKGVFVVYFSSHSSCAVPTCQLPFVINKFFIDLLSPSGRVLGFNLKETTSHCLCSLFSNL